MESRSSLSQWLNSDIFIVVVVLLILLMLFAFAGCWLMKRFQTRKPPEEMAEIELTPINREDVENPNPPKFILKIVTQQTHATELVEMLTQRRSPIEHPNPAGNPSVAAADDDPASASAVAAVADDTVSHESIE